MPDIMGNVPMMHCLVRGEYLRDRQRGHGEYVEAFAYGVRCVRGHSLWFQCALQAPYGGVNFLLPIRALVTKPCPDPEVMTYVQPWDCFSSTFGIVEFDFIKRGEAYVLPAKEPGQYQFTIDFTGSDLADYPDQHKHLHVVKMGNGLIGAFPNNRVLTPDPAFAPMMTERPDFMSISGEYRAEGNQHLFDVRRVTGETVDGPPEEQTIN